MSRRRKRIWLGGSKRNPVCCDGPPDHDVCHNFSLLQADESDFHDRWLIEATESINHVLRDVGEHAPPDRHLALINTGLGLLLVWSEAIERPNDISGYVTYESSEEEIRDALNLPDDESAAKTGALAVRGRRFRMKTDCIPA